MQCVVTPPQRQIGEDTDNNIAAFPCRQEGHIRSAQQARRAYAKAVHMKPSRGSAWGDAASALYIEVQLWRSHSRLRPEDAPALLEASERCIRGVALSLWALM